MGSGGKGTAGPSTAAREAAFYTWLVGETGPAGPWSREKRGRIPFCADGERSEGSRGVFLRGEKMQVSFPFKAGCFVCSVLHAGAPQNRKDLELAWASYCGY